MRRNIYDLPAHEREELAQVIQRYSTPAVVEEHWEAVLDGVHHEPRGFLAFHRYFITQLENSLRDQGYGQWVPLPAWNSAEPIPPEFNIPDRGVGRLRNLDPGISFAPEFAGENLARFRTEEELGLALMARHNEVHRAVGGVMNNQRRAPEAPIFWLFHAFVDDIWREWQTFSTLNWRMMI